MTLELFNLVISRCSYPGFTFKIGVVAADVRYLQVRCADACNVSGESMEWGGRKWLLSKHMTVSEVVQTVFKAVSTAVEHEMREKFKYRGQAIFGPHFNVEHFVSLSLRDNALDERK